MSVAIRMPLPRRFTVNEYLVIERKAETKSEFHQGAILAMAGGLPDHNKIALNISGALWVGLKGGPSTAYSSDQRIAVAGGESIYYPDISVICGELKLFGRHRDVAENPKMVVEILSKSTGRYDRLVKVPLYQRTPTLTDVLLVAQDRVRVEHISREDGNSKWKPTVYGDLSDVIELASIQCTLPLSDIYLNVGPAS
jgi:Uma2 family endonuclease